MEKTVFIFGEGELPKLILKKLKNPLQSYIIVFNKKLNFNKKFQSKSINLGKVISELKKLKLKGFSSILMAGSMRRPNIKEIKPDFNSIKLIPKFTKILFAGGDNNLLEFVIKELEKIGFKVLSLNKIYPDFFLGPGNQTNHTISKSFLFDIKKGKTILENNSKFDIGQSIVMQQGSVIGIEAAQGTDNLLRQSSRYTNKKGILIKLAKLNQDLRADLPTIGIRTLKNCYKYGICGVAYSANKTIFINKEKVLEFCKNNNIFLFGI